MGREKSQYNENQILSHYICYQQSKYDSVRQGHKAIVRIIIMGAIYLSINAFCLYVSFW